MLAEPMDNAGIEESELKSQNPDFELNANGDDADQTNAEQNADQTFDQAGELNEGENENEGEGEADAEQPVEAEKEENPDASNLDLAPPDNIETTLIQHEKEYLEQEASRKEKIKESLLDRQKVPTSYYTNSKKELLILQYIENFDRQYSQVYPGRKQLMLYRPNEFGTRKFVCSTIRPTQLPLKVTYDYRSCASFVAAFIEYIPLEPPHEIPTALVSPTYTLKMQQGNCFDMATLLASLLIGVGYDAYVVSGYAVKSITTMDQSQYTENSLKELLPHSFLLDRLKKDEAVVEEEVNTKYKVKTPKELKSSFLKKQQEKLKVMQQALEQRNKESQQVPQTTDDDDEELKGLRIHAWVLILPGKREVSEAFFIEPSTGCILDCESDRYLGVESVWNSKNFWVNMQICYDGLKGISFDLVDNVKWEFVLLDNTAPSIKKNNEENEEEEEEEEEKQTEIVDLPGSWVSKLEITKEQFESKCPGGTKTTLYKNAKNEVFAEYRRKDGMVNRIQYTVTDEVFSNLLLEIFANRKDKLSHRIRKGDLIHEYFHPGRSHGLKEHIIVGGVTKQMEFYNSARPDGLYRMTDEPRKNICYFQNRDDLLVYRSVTFETTEQDGKLVRGQLVKIAEKYDRNNAIPAYQDYYKKTFFIKEEKIRTVYHLKEGMLINSVREYKKPAPEQKGNLLEMIQNFIVDPTAKVLKTQHLITKLMELLRNEQSVLQAIKNSERELSDILNLRLIEEQELNLSSSIYDTLRNETNVDREEDGIEVNKEEETTKSQEIDYLSPFLINCVIKYLYQENINALTKEEMTAAKDACLKSLRDRLVERANIIQGRLEEITAEYQKKQLAYSKNADSMTVEETNEYVKFCNYALFKIQILEKRLAKHKEIAPERYMELDAKLRADPRLASLY